MIKNIVPLFIVLFSSFVVNAQTDPELAVRVDSMIYYTRTSNYEKMLDYTYPKVFTITPRKQLSENLIAYMNGEEYSSSFDSVQLLKIYPVFTVGKGQYTKIKHTLVMRMKFKKELSEEEAHSLIDQMETGFGEGHVQHDEENNSIVISLISYMAAAKDEFSKKWSFTNYNSEDPMMSRLFNKQVTDKLKASN